MNKWNYICLATLAQASKDPRFTIYPFDEDGGAEVRFDGKRAVVYEMGFLTWKLVGGSGTLEKMTGFCGKPFQVEGWLRWLQTGEFPS